MNAYLLTMVLLFANGQYHVTKMYDFPSYKTCMKAGAIAQPFENQNPKTRGYVYWCERGFKDTKKIDAKVIMKDSFNRD